VKRAGFTLIELTMVMAVTAVVIGLGVASFTGLFQKNAARYAARLFAQDLVAARSFAVRSQEPVVIRFYEATLRYEVEGRSSLTGIARRRFGADGENDLSAVTLDLAGDSLVFDVRGMADLSGASGALGVATFSSGAASYTVSFNGMGASKIEQT
jgi:prepilin-type N-terminal cleavage/methylation domain-containing protein